MGCRKCRWVGVERCYRHLSAYTGVTKDGISMNTNVDILGPWAWKQMGMSKWNSEGRSAIGELNAMGTPRWAVVYDHYEPGGSIQVHIAISNPKYVTRQAISAVFEYAFLQLGVKKVIGVVNSTNRAALTFDLRLGFEIEAVIEDAYDMGDMYILSMTPEQCRWIRGQHYGQLSKRSATA